MSKDVETALLQGSMVVHRGKVMTIDPEDGSILISEGRDSRNRLRCLPLRTGAEMPAVQSGDSVIYLVPEEDPAMGYILGVIDRSGPATVQKQKSRTAAGEDVPPRLVLEGKEEVILRTGRSTIVLRSNGDIEIRGKRIVSRARDLQKLAAPMLKLN